jgi:secreted trypsin-like serine protease
MSNNVRPICLPLEKENYLMAKENKEIMKFFVMGFGRTESGKRSNKLLYTTIPLVPLDKCRVFYQNSNAVLNDDRICAGKFAHDSCQGKLFKTLYFGW